MKFNYSKTFFIISILFIYACQDNTQIDKPLYKDPILKYTISQSDLDKYISYRNIKDTTGKTKEYLQLLKGVVLRLKNTTAAITYEKAVNDAEDFLRRKNMVNKVLVIKNERKMYLLKDKKIIKTYPISLGPNPIGQKEYEGDGKTPEGTYTLDWQKWNSSTLHSFHISYPNKLDSIRAKMKNLQVGSNIMVHGTSIGPKKKKDWTNGCIALSNNNMNEFMHMVFQDTQIEIRK